jgi:hypothetical protein
MAKPSSRDSRRWFTTAEAMRFLRAPSRRALDRWVASGKLQTCVRDGVRCFSGAAIERGAADRDASASAAGEGLSPEEMTVLARPVRRPDPAPRAPSGKDVAESLPRVLEPYITGLHEKIDGLSARVSTLSSAIEERPKPEEVHAEVVVAERSARPAPETEAASRGSRLFEAFASPRRPARAGIDEASSGDGEDYSLRERRLPRTFLVAIVLAAAAVAATVLLWLMFGS